MPIRVHHCAQLAHSTLDRPVFDLELEGVPEWQGVRLGAPDTRFPDRTWERTTRSSGQGRYQPVGPRARMTRPKGSGEVQQQPEDARDVPDHKGDLAMANVESAVVDVDEEDEDMFLVLLFLTLCLHAVDCPWWQPRTGVMAHGGGGGCTNPPRGTPSPGFLPGAPGASGGGNSGGTSPGGPPLGEAPRTGPPGGLEGVYTPTAREGAPVRGDGPRSSLGEGCSPGSGEDPHTAVGGSRYNREHSRRGATAPPPTGCDRRGSRRTPPPPRGEQGLGGWPGVKHCLSGERQRRGPHHLPTRGGPCPDLPTSEPSVAVM